jgi:hypothetical protein
MSKAATLSVSVRFGAVVMVTGRGLSGSFGRRLDDAQQVQRARELLGAWNSGDSGRAVKWFMRPIYTHIEGDPQHPIAVFR